MHPLAAPAALAQAAFAAATVLVTLQRGTPFALLTTRYGRTATGALALVFVLVVALWVARTAGAFGGPVAV
jgi:hypothetical protein